MFEFRFESVAKNIDATTAKSWAVLAKDNRAVGEPRLEQPTARGHRHSHFTKENSIVEKVRGSRFRQRHIHQMPRKRCVGQARKLGGNVCVPWQSDSFKPIKLHRTQYCDGQSLSRLNASIIVDIFARCTASSVTSGIMGIQPEQSGLIQTRNHFSNCARRQDAIVDILRCFPLRTPLGIVARQINADQLQCPNRATHHFLA